MAGARRNHNGKIDRLDDAMRALVQAQANLVNNQAAFEAQIIDLQRLNAERYAQIESRFAQIDSRFARIESILLDHSRILGEHSRTLADHGRILQALPEAVREKIGFRPG